MTKLCKWLMVLFIPLFSLILASCGDDDEDEPTPSVTPDSQFIIGEWFQGSHMWLKFDENGTYAGCWGDEENIGTWSYKNGIITVVFNMYKSSTYIGEGNVSCHVKWDSYTQTLVFYDFTESKGQTPLFAYGSGSYPPGQFRRDSW